LRIDHLTEGELPTVESGQGSGMMLQLPKP
jgi:hypothetical protein